MTNTPTTPEITYAIDERWASTQERTIVLDTADGEVRDTTYRSATDVYLSRVRATLSGAALTAWLRDHEAAIVEILTATGEDQSELACALEAGLLDAQAGDEIAAYWSADDWMAGDPPAPAVLASEVTIAHGFAAWGAQTNEAARPDHLVDADDLAEWAEGTLREWLRTDALDDLDAYGAERGDDVAALASAMRLCDYDHLGDVWGTLPTTRWVVPTEDQGGADGTLEWRWVDGELYARRGFRASGAVLYYLADTDGLAPEALAPYERRPRDESGDDLALTLIAVEVVS